VELFSANDNKFPASVALTRTMNVTMSLLTVVMLLSST